MSNILDRVSTVLTGEPARVIGYGGAVVVYIVARATVIPDVSFEDAIVQVTAAAAIVATFVESIRRIVYSPNTVEAIIVELEEGNG